MSIEERRAERILEIIRDFRGLPVTYLDLEELLGLSIRQAKAPIAMLVDAGLVERSYFDRGVAMLRDAVALREENAA